MLVFLGLPFYESSSGHLGVFVPKGGHLAAMRPALRRFLAALIGDARQVPAVESAPVQFSESAQCDHQYRQDPQPLLLRIRAVWWRSLSGPD